MANKILIEGKSGTGKSHAARNLDPKTTFIICPDKKALPFKGWKKKYRTVLDKEGNVTKETNFIKTDSFADIERYLNLINTHKPEIKVVLIDTISMALNKSFMNRASEKGYDKFTEMAQELYKFLDMLDGLRDDLTVIVCAHVEVDTSTGVERRTFQIPAGKLMKDKITVPSMFTMVLETVVTHGEDGSKYQFLTQNDGNNDAKAPEFLFETRLIDNDYQLVLDAMDKYENEEEEVVVEKETQPAEG